MRERIETIARRVVTDDRGRRLARELVRRGADHYVVIDFVTAAPWTGNPRVETYLFRVPVDLVESVGDAIRACHEDPDAWSGVWPDLETVGPLDTVEWWPTPIVGDARD